MPFRTLTRTRTHTLTQDAAALEEEAAGEEADRAMDLGEQEDKEPPAAQDTAEQGGRSTQGEQRQGGVGGSDAKPDAMQQDEQDSAQQRAQVGPRGRDEGREQQAGPEEGEAEEETAAQERRTARQRAEANPFRSLAEEVEEALKKQNARDPKEAEVRACPSACRDDPVRARVRLGVGWRVRARTARQHHA